MSINQLRQAWKREMRYFWPSVGLAAGFLLLGMLAINVFLPLVR